MGEGAPFFRVEGSGERRKKAVGGRRTGEGAREGGS